VDDIVEKSLKNENVWIRKTPLETDNNNNNIRGIPPGKIERLQSAAPSAR